MPGDRAHSVVLCWGMRLKEAKEAEAAGRLSEEDGNFLRLFSRWVAGRKGGGHTAESCALLGRTAAVFRSGVSLLDRRR